MKFGGRFFQTKLLSRLSHKVCRRLSSPVLLRKFTNIKDKKEIKLDTGHFFCGDGAGIYEKDPSFSPCLAMQP